MSTHNGNAQLDLIKAAKCVIALSGWSKIPDGREVYQTSYMAVEVLRQAVQEHENPVLQLTPEPINPGKV